MKAKKLLAFLLVSTLLVSMFAVSASAVAWGEIYESGGGWNKYNFWSRDYPELSNEQALSVAGVRFYYTIVNREEDDVIAGDIGFEYRSGGWWDSTKFSEDPDPATHRATMTDTYVELLRRAPILEEDDVNYALDVTSENAVARVHIAFWSDSEVTIDRVEMLDASGNVLVPERGGSAAAAAEPAAAASDDGAAAAPTAPAAAPRTGDASMVALFSLLAIVSATGLVVLRKTRKQGSH